MLAGIEVNGEEIARLGTNEYTQYTVNGNYSVFFGQVSMVLEWVVAELQAKVKKAQNIIT